MTACAAGPQCAGYDRATGAGAAADAGDGPLCPGCLRAAAADIAALPRDHADLTRELVPIERGLSHVAAPGADDAGVPLALDVEALQRSIFWALTVWEPPVREAAGLSPERVGGVRDAWAVARAAAVIAPRTDVLAALGPTWGFADGLDAGPVARDGEHAVAQLRGLHRRARAVAGLTRLVYELPGECSRCGAAALRRTNGSDTVRCEVCERRWTYDDYQRYVGLMLVEVQR